MCGLKKQEKKTITRFPIMYYVTWELCLRHHGNQYRKKKSNVAGLKLLFSFLKELDDVYKKKNASWAYLKTTVA